MREDNLRRFSSREDLAVDPSNPTTWYRRREAARVLKCSLQTVYNYETKGLIHGKILNGRKVFDPLEVEMLRTRISAINRAAKSATRDTKGDIEAAVYRMLDHGATRNEIVEHLHITADEAQRIWANYQITEFDQADERTRRLNEEKRIAELEHQREQKRLARMKRLRELLQATGGSK